MPFSKISNSDLKVILNSTKRNSKAYIKIIMNRTRETMKCFYEINQIFNEANDLISWDYYDINDLNNIHTKEQDL